MNRENTTRLFTRRRYLGKTLVFSPKKRQPQTSRPTPPRTRAHTVSTNPGYLSTHRTPYLNYTPTKRQQLLAGVGISVGKYL
ncbi:hypothetical protein GCM10010207_64740 [Streptomyces atratus]|nr:hypothetical protein GCM10010207_64740 [Streptomyces atratus]